MKLAPDHLVKLIEPIVEGMGYECVGIEYNPHPQHGLLRVYIDKDTGVLVDDCTRVSHQISGILDVEDPIQSNYQLEISSPGTERPLFNSMQFEQFKGQKVLINLFKPIAQRRKISGLIGKVENDVVQIQGADQVFEIPVQLMSKARLVPDYFVEKGKHDGK